MKSTFIILMNHSLLSIVTRGSGPLRRLLFMIPWIALASCACIPGSVTDVSREPRVAAYLREPRQLVNDSYLLGDGRKLPAGTRLELTRIHRIQGDGFVLFRATGRVFPADLPQGAPFTYKWGHGGTSPQAPWEPPGERLKKQLGLE